MKKLVAAPAALALLAPAALASSASMKVNPSPATAGHTVTVQGTADKGCKVGKKHPAKIYSQAFNSSQKFAGVPAVKAKLAKDHSFSVKATIKTSASGAYKVSGRCSTGKFASVTLQVIGFY